MGLKMLKEHWYEIDYEDEPNDNTTVLYTSTVGLKALTDEMQRIGKLNSTGRYLITLSDPDKEYEAPFTHIEIIDAPPEPDDETLEDFAKQWKKPLFFIGSAIVIVGFLSLYGLVRLVIDIV